MITIPPEKFEEWIDDIVCLGNSCCYCPFDKGDGGTYDEICGKEIKKLATELAKKYKEYMEANQ